VGQVAGEENTFFFSQVDLNLQGNDLKPFFFNIEDGKVLESEWDINPAILSAV
jgi:hypothetical protein